MMEFAVLLMDAHLENVPLLLIMIDAAITTNAPSIDAQQLVAPIPQLFVMMVMLAPPINVIPEQENVLTLHVLPKILILAQPKLVMQNWELSILQRIVMTVLLALLILAMLIVDVKTLQIMHFVTIKILAL